MTDLINNPPHYTRHPSGVECIQITEHMSFCLGNAIKYLWRADEKGAAIEDLRKAAWYIEREILRRTATVANLDHPVSPTIEDLTSEPAVSSSSSGQAYVHDVRYYGPRGAEMLTSRIATQNLNWCVCGHEGFRHDSTNPPRRCNFYPGCNCLDFTPADVRLQGWQHKDGCHRDHFTGECSVEE